jgi:hypothetical protein
MSESSQAELALWQSRCDEMQVALDRMREHRDDLQQENTVLKDNVKTYISMVERMRLAMSQGREL